MHGELVLGIGFNSKKDVCNYFLSSVGGGG